MQGMRTAHTAHQQGLSSCPTLSSVLVDVANFLRGGQRREGEPDARDLRGHFTDVLERYKFVYPATADEGPTHSGWRVVCNQGSTMQVNTSDCGVLTMHMMRVLAETSATDMPSVKHTGFDAVDILRAHMCAEMARMRLSPLPLAKVVDVFPADPEAEDVVVLSKPKDGEEEQEAHFGGRSQEAGAPTGRVAQLPVVDSCGAEGQREGGVVDTAE